MIISATKNQRIVVKNRGEVIAYIDDFGIPVITAEFFKLTPQEWNMFWDFVETFKGKY